LSPSRSTIRDNRRAAAARTWSLSQPIARIAASGRRGDLSCYVSGGSKTLTTTAGASSAVGHDLTPGTCARRGPPMPDDPAPLGRRATRRQATAAAAGPLAQHVGRRRPHDPAGVGGSSASAVCRRPRLACARSGSSSPSTRSSGGKLRAALDLRQLAEPVDSASDDVPRRAVKRCAVPAALPAPCRCRSAPGSSGSHRGTRPRVGEPSTRQRRVGDRLGMLCVSCYSGREQRHLSLRPPLAVGRYTGCSKIGQ
jgi:hypothetical protein